MGLDFLFVSVQNGEKSKGEILTQETLDVCRGA